MSCQKNFAQKNFDKRNFAPKIFDKRNFNKIIFLNRKFFAEQNFLDKIFFSQKLFFRHKTCLADFWLGLVGMVILTHTAILEGNSTYTNPKKLKFGIQVQLTKTR